MTTIVAPPINASKWQMGFNSAFKGLIIHIEKLLFVLRTIRYDMIYLLTAIGLIPGGSSIVHIYTLAIYRTTKLTQTIHRKTQLTEQHN
jgi:hypothetical protein